MIAFLDSVILHCLSDFFFTDHMKTVATPKQIRELMKVDGLTNDEVKSHLQVCFGFRHA